MLQKAAGVLAALVNDEILIFNFAGCQSAGDVFHVVRSRSD